MKIEIWILVLLLFAGCAAEDDPGNAAGHGAGLIDVDVDLSFTVSESDAPVTRSVAFTAEGEELGVKGADSTAIATAVADTSVVQTKAASAADNTISTLWIGQYDAAGNLLIAHYVTGIIGNQASFQLKETPSCSLRFVANGGDLGKPAKLSEFNTKQIAYTANPTSCPMYGELNGQRVSVTYKPSVTLMRMLSHIHLSYSVASGSDFTFTPTHVKLLSVPLKMQCVEPTGPLSGITYTSFTVNATASSGTYDWYIPENKSGTIASGQNGFASGSREKTGGTSVPDASYLEIGGNAEVNGVTFTNVVYRLYLGSSSNVNDYNVKRNTTYNVTLTLSGIDFSDPRVLVTAPALVPPAQLAAVINSTTTLQVTSRPGELWQMVLPDWLSATVNGTTVKAGGIVSQSDPFGVVLTAATTNPDSSIRNQNLSIVAGGASRSVTVTQAGSTLTASGSPTTLGAAKDASGTLTFNGTSGLSFSATTPAWLTLTGTTTGTTDGADQTFGYKTNALNLNSTARTAENITVTAGNITTTVAITQSGSSFTVDKTEIQLEKTATSGSVTVKGTAGLPWTVSPSVTTSGITPATTSSTATGGAQPLTFKASANTGITREVTFTVRVSGGNHSKKVKVKQAGLNGVTIDQALATAYEKWRPRSTYPAFDKDGVDYKGNSSTNTITTPYTIEVESTQSSSNYIYNTNAPQKYCASLGSGWRIPTNIEQYAMWNTCKGTTSTALGAKFRGTSYWTSSVYNGDYNFRATVSMNAGSIGGTPTSVQYAVRCVRDR